MRTTLIPSRFRGPALAALVACPAALPVPAVARAQTVTPPAPTTRRSPTAAGADRQASSAARSSGAQPASPVAASTITPRRTDLAGPVTPWPRPIPIRLAPDGRDEVLVATLGEVSTPLADGVFDPVADRVTTASGRVIEHYYRDTLGIAYYEPIDKTIFPLPPSGWCTWYYYYSAINPDEFLANARWIAKNLAAFGAQYVQLDDGWQGSGAGEGRKRDWTTIDERFERPGMAALADSIHALGLEPGIWIAPHGQSDAQVAQGSGAFLWKPDGSTASTTWEGGYLIDPTAPAATDYLESLFGRLRDWGYTYFKIDGQTVVLREYARKAQYMAGPVPDGDPERVAADLYRGTLRTIRHAIGPQSYLLASWGTPTAGVGLYNGSRTGGDVVQGWAGFLGAMSAVQRWYFLHNVAWYSDPDVLLVRPPMTEGTARSWATALGLTGQALMASDRLTDLPESRVELLRRVYPAVDSRPLDLFRPANTRKPLIDLKVSHLGRQYDVVGVFNYDAERTATRRLSWEALGLDPKAMYHIYDFWNGTYYGAWEDGVFIDVPPGDVRVITLVPATDRPVLLSTSRHITQGWVDLLALEHGGTSTRPALSGRSRVIGGDPYTLTIGLPRGAATLRLARAHASGVGPGASSPVDVAWATHQGYATVTIRSDSTRTIAWELQFEPAEPYVYPVTSPNRLDADPTGLADATLRWRVEYYQRAAYRIEVDGNPIGVAFQPHVPLNGLAPGSEHRITVRSLWSDGSAAENVAELAYTPPVPESVYLSDLEPVSVRQDWEGLGRDRTVTGDTLTVAGTTHEKGIGTLSDSELRYRLYGIFTRFTAAVGFDDDQRGDAPAQAVFEVRGDGRLLWRSEPLATGDEPMPVDVDVSGVQELTLRVIPTAAPGTDRDDALRVDWLDARLTGRAAAE